MKNVTTNAYGPGNTPVYNDGELVVAGTYNSIRLGDGKTAGGNPVSAGTLVEEFQQVVTNASAGYVTGGKYGTPAHPQEIEIYRGDNMLEDKTGGDTTKDFDEDLMTDKNIMLRRESGGTGAIDLTWWAFGPGVKTIYLYTIEGEEDIVVHYHRGATAKSITVTYEQPVMFKCFAAGTWTAFQSVA